MAYTFKHGDRPLSDYTIQRAVGRGGFGEVYYAISDGGREVALKYLRENPQVELRGVSHCINLKSPHLVSIFDVVQSAEGEYFVVMEYISGPSLRDIILAEPNGIGTQKAAYLARELGKGLAYLHDRGIVHRDLKPGNVFYDEGYVKIGDYGLSKFISHSRHSAQTTSVGTVAYMAPEVGSGNYSRTIDIYALGVILYEMLLGHVPFEGSSMGEVLMKHLTTKPEVNGLPAPFNEVILRALAKDPNDRYQTVPEMIKVLEIDEVRDSLVGFDPSILSQAAIGERPEAFVSPRPSPMPPRPAPMPPRRSPIPPRHPPMSPRFSPGGPVRAMRRPGRGYARSAGLAPEAAAGPVRYAGFWIRVVAALIDVAVLMVVSAIFASTFIGVVGPILYDGLLLGYWNGQTLGKKACGIKVISADGRPCGVGQAFIRSVSSIVSAMALMIGYVMVAFHPRKQALHDLMAGTLHVYALKPQWPGA